MSLEYRIRFVCDCDNSIIADELFTDLSPETSHSLESIKKTKSFDEDSAVCLIGDVPEGILVLVEGQAELSVLTESNKKNVIRSIKPHEIIGLTEMLANTSYQINIITTKPCVFEFIPNEDFLAFLRSDSNVCFHLCQLLCIHLKKAVDFLALQ